MGADAGTEPDAANQPDAICQAYCRCLQTRKLACRADSSTASCACPSGPLDAGYDGADAAPTCDPTLAACNAALTCFDDGMEYPSMCGPANCDTPIGPCRAGECMHVDLSRYDRSCTNDADCIAIQSVVCPNQCACANAAINAAGAARYAAAIAQIPQAAPGDCNGCAVPAPTVVCAQGVCTYCQPGVPGCRFGVDAGHP